MSAARAVLWDMDGTLIDSEEQHWISWRNTLAKEGIVITREQFLATFGQRNDSIIPQLLGAAATPERIARISEAKEELYRYLIRRDGISPLPGVASWLHRLHEQGWLQAIASAAPRANIDAVLEALVSYSHFPRHRIGRGCAERQTGSRSLSEGCFAGRGIARELHCCGRRRCRDRGRPPCRYAEHRGKSRRSASARRCSGAVSCSAGFGRL